MKNLKQKVALAIGFVSTTLLAASASAALPSAVTSAITGATTAISDAETAVWPAIGAFILASIIIRKVKFFTGKI